MLAADQRDQRQRTGRCSCKRRASRCAAARSIAASMTATVGPFALQVDPTAGQVQSRDVDSRRMAPPHAQTTHGLPSGPSRADTRSSSAIWSPSRRPPARRITRACAAAELRDGGDCGHDRRSGLNASDWTIAIASTALCAVAHGLTPSGDSRCSPDRTRTARIPAAAAPATSFGWSPTKIVALRRPRPAPRARPGTESALGLR